MAKELPYFKFEPNEWENGNIQMLSREEKGLFIDLCSMYWSRLGDVPLKLAIQKLCGGNANALQTLCEEKIIEVINDNIFIKFLSIQLSEFEDISKKNRKSALDAWEKRRKQKEESERNANALQTQSERNAIREDKIIEDKIIKDKKNNSVPLFDWDGFLKFYNDTFNRKVTRITDLEKKKFNRLIKNGFTKEDILKAILNAKKDKFCIEKEYKHCTVEYFSREKTINMFGTISEKKTVTNNYNGTL